LLRRRNPEDSMSLPLTLGCVSYDRTIPLADGTVAPSGIDLRITNSTPGDLFRRQARDAEFDVAEFSLSTYAMLRGQGDDRFVALPVFPSRMFRHRSIFVNVKSGIRQPADLAGRRIGAAEFQQTAGVWMRGIVEREYGVSQDEVEWYFGAYNAPGPYHERAPVALPASLRTHTIPETECLSDLLEAGEIDAVFAAQAPAAFYRHSPNVARLFPDYPAAERDHFRRTGLFPIMHTLVIRRSIYDAEPWIARSIFDAFLEAKRVGTERLSTDGRPYAGLPWLTHHLEELVEVMGPDPYPYGFAANRSTVATFLEMSHGQGLTPRVLAPEELFVPELLAS
jgi:4,5-dihydroxyphthalate decarboxylase